VPPSNRLHHHLRLSRRARINFSRPRKKTKTVAEWPTPTTKKQLASFTGLVGYFRHHIPPFADISYPLTQLLAKYKPQKLKWLHCRQMALETLKAALVSRPVLCPPDWSRDYEIWADSSQTCLSAILMQRDEQDGTSSAPSSSPRSSVSRVASSSTGNVDTRP